MVGVIPVLHLNSYKISGSTVTGRHSEHQLNELIRGFGYTPVRIEERLASSKAPTELYQETENLIGQEPQIVFDGDDSDEAPTSYF